MRIYIKNANGNKICIARREGLYRLSKLDIGVIEDSVSTSKIACNDGYYVQKDALFLGKRSICIGFSNYAATTVDFMRALNPKFMVELTFEDKGICRKITGKVVGTPKIARDRTKQVEFNVDCYNPFFESDVKAKTFVGRAEVNNGGDVDCSFRLAIKGQTNGINPTLKNEISGKYISFEGVNLKAGDIIEADSSIESRRIKITRADGTVENGYNYLSIAEDCQLFDFVAGENVLSCTSGKSECEAAVSFSEKFFDWGVVV